MTSAPNDETVTVYWRPGCPYCMRLRRGLRRRGLPRTEINIWTDQEAAAFVRSVADGNETVPTVTVAGQAMVNPTPRQVLDAVADHAPGLLQQARRPPRGLRARRARRGA